MGKDREYEEPFDALSFGAMLPENWQEVADFLNAYYQTTEEDAEDIWEKYCSGLLDGAPTAKGE